MPRLQSIATLVFSLVVLALSVVLVVLNPGHHALYSDEGRPVAAWSQKVVSGR